MKNKGFTLIELLIVVALLGTLAIIITVNMTASFQKTKQEECSKFVKDIEDLACVYASLSNKEVPCERGIGCTLTLDLLVREGLNYEKDVCTNGDLDLTNTVSVSYDASGEKICRYNGVRTYER